MSSLAKHLLSKPRLKFSKGQLATYSKLFKKSSRFADYSYLVNKPKKMPKAKSKFKLMLKSGQLKIQRRRLKRSY